MVKKKSSRTSARVKRKAPSKRKAGPVSSPPTSPPPRETESKNFSVVGIGASAGGLDAMTEFFKHIPAASGMAFVVVQHLDPNHKCLLADLLQHVTSMPVREATDGVRIERDHVYVIPPKHDMSILHGVLHLFPLERPEASLPIDFFMRSLADDQGERAIGVVLSGAGSDGTLGLRAIREKNGATFVQTPASAKFDSMPRSAIDAGGAEGVGSPKELVAKIVAYLRSETGTRVHQEDRGLTENHALEKIYVLLRGQTGHDFSLYKRSTIFRRIERRMGLHQINNIDHYVRYLRQNPEEVQLLFRELLIGVTTFFRDTALWEHLKNEVLPALLDTHPLDRVLRAWVPGCSTGEEAYSLAMVFREAVEKIRPHENITLQVFATDIDNETIERARSGLFPANIVADVSPERLSRFFVREGDGYRITKKIRETVVFAPQNVVMDPPFTRLDILSCRNLLIYMSVELQQKVIPLFHYSLSPRGVLVLGSAETIGSSHHLFSPIDNKMRIYRRLDGTGGSTLNVDFPPAAQGSAQSAAPGTERSPLQSRPVPTANLQALADRVLVQRFAPVGLLCTEGGDLLYLSGRAGKYLEPAVGKANLNIFAMARDGLRYELSKAFSSAVRGAPVSVSGVKVGTNGGSQLVDLTVEKLLEPKELRGMVMVVMADAPVTPSASKHRQSTAAPTPRRVTEMERELQRSLEEVRSVREEMQSSQEELKAANEELQSTNEELQSTNEELTTSKEEMQSLNEELQTVNGELQSKVDQLSRSNNDMKNLLNSTDIATLFLDGELNVRRFTTPTTKIIKLIASDVGRPITDITSDLDYPSMAEDAREVLRTLVFKERQVSTGKGGFFMVRVMPYRTLENVIDGVVITFTDTAQALATSLREQASQLRQLAESLPNLVWGCSPNGSCDYLSPQWLAYTGNTQQPQTGLGWLAQVHPEDREATREAWGAAVRAGTPFDHDLRIRGAGGTYRWFKSRCVPIRDEQHAIIKWYGTHTDIDDIKLATAQGYSLSGLQQVLDRIENAVVTLNAACEITFCNGAALRLLRCEGASVRYRNFFDAFPALRNSTFEQSLLRVLSDKVSLQFDAQVGDSSAAEVLSTHMVPQLDSDGVWILFEPRA